MDLLPKSHTEFSSAEYWEKFFKKRGKEAFEWYGTYTELCGILHKYIKLSEKVVVVGCGNSQLSADMYDVGYHNLVNIDISEVTIKQMVEKNKEKRSDMKFLQMDALKMDFADGDFNVALDKGMLDALMTDSTDETNEKIDKMFSEIGRVLKLGGRYICISLSQSHILDKVLEYFPNEGWMVRVHRVTQQDDDTDKEFHMPVFVFVFTKFKKMPNMPSILEVAQFDDCVERYDSVTKVKAAVKEMQQYGLIRHQLQTKSQVGEGISLDLYSSESSSSRYTLHIVDRRKKSRNKFAVFIVPEGRETEWMFSTDEGRTHLSETAGFDRLVVATLHRDHTYGDLDSVKDELSGKVLELAPPGLDRVKVPFLSVGDDIGKRTIRHEGKSEFNGPFVVEDVEADSATYRRLIFLNSKNIIQAETKLVRDRSKKKSGKKNNKLCADVNSLSFDYHSVMVAGLALLQDFDKTMDQGVSSIIIGLGGGGLVSFIQNNYRKVTTDVVDIDPVMVTIATDWFGLKPTDSVKIHTADGIKFIQDLAIRGEKRHIVMVDVQNQDTPSGMSSPPPAYLQSTFLNSVNDVLHANGVLIVNVVCRNSALRIKVIEDLKVVFPTIYSKKLEKDVNEILFALPRSRTQKVDLKDNKLSKQLQSALRILHDVAKVESKGASNLPNISYQLENLKIIHE